MSRQPLQTRENYGGRKIVNGINGEDECLTGQSNGDQSGKPKFPPAPERINEKWCDYKELHVQVKIPRLTHTLINIYQENETIKNDKDCDFSWFFLPGPQDPQEKNC